MSTPVGEAILPQGDEVLLSHIAGEFGGEVQLLGTLLWLAALCYQLLVPPVRNNLSIIVFILIKMNKKTKKN